MRTGLKVIEFLRFIKFQLWESYGYTLQTFNFTNVINSQDSLGVYSYEGRRIS